MSQATRPNYRHIIWSNQNLDVDDLGERITRSSLKLMNWTTTRMMSRKFYEWMEGNELRLPLR